MKLTDLFEQTELSYDVQNTLPPTFVIPKLQSSDAYMQYRHSVAMAAARSQQGDKAKKESAWGENQAVICYSDAEIETLEMANKIMGVESKVLSSSKSTENKSVNKVSPVRKFKDYL